MKDTSNCLAAAFLLSAVVFCSCTRDISRVQPFAPYVGQTLKLKRPAELHEFVEGKQGNHYLNRHHEDGTISEYLRAPHTVRNPDSVYTTTSGRAVGLVHITNALNASQLRYYMKNSDPRWRWIPVRMHDDTNVWFITRHFWILKPGHVLSVSNVTRVLGDGTVDFYANGEVQHPETGKMVPLRYRWGSFDAIDRAPWEDESVPTNRYVGMDGKQYGNLRPVRYTPLGTPVYEDK